MAVSGVHKPSPVDLLSTTPTTAKSKVKANATSSGSTTSGLDSTTTGTTFLNLLVKELQNQDPTAPMDSTAMVGQMISLNQLDQLISINQNLTTSTTTTATGKAAGAGSAALMAQQSALLSGTTGTAAQAAALSASDPNSTLDFSNLNIPNGGR